MTKRNVEIVFGNAHFRRSTERIYKYLKTHTATATMVSEALGIPQKNVCRYKRALEETGRLWEVKRAKCEITRQYAWYLSTDPNLKREDNQLKLF